MTPLEKRIKELKTYLDQEEDKNSLYAQDLKLSIEQLTAQLPKQNKKGYVMVGSGAKCPHLL